MWIWMSFFSVKFVFNERCQIIFLLQIFCLKGNYSWSVIKSLKYFAAFLFCLHSPSPTFSRVWTGETRKYSWQSFALFLSWGIIWEKIVWSRICSKLFHNCLVILEDLWGRPSFFFLSPALISVANTMIIPVDGNFFLISLELPFLQLNAEILFFVSCYNYFSSIKYKLLM